MECERCGNTLVKGGTYANKKCLMQMWRCLKCGKTKTAPVEGSMGKQVILELIEKRTQELRKECEGVTRTVIDLNGNEREVNFDELQEIIDEAIKKVVKINGR